jgi:hypothetical protein
MVDDSIRNDVPDGISRTSNAHEQDDVSKKDGIVQTPSDNNADKEDERDKDDAKYQRLE